MTVARFDSTTIAHQDCCALLGLRAALNDDRVKTCWHEAGHCLLALLMGLGWKSADVIPSDGLAGRVVMYEDSEPRLIAPTRLARIAVDCAGAIGEEVAFASVTEGAVLDLRIALSRPPPDVAVCEVAEAVRRTRNAIRANDRALAALAEALGKKGRLTRMDGARIAWSAGAIVRMTPTWTPIPLQPEWTALRQEAARVEHVLMTFDASRDVGSRVAEPLAEPRRHDAKPRPERTPKDAETQWREYCRMVPDRLKRQV